MKRLFRTEKNHFTRWLPWMVGASILFLLYRLMPILSPFIAAAVTAYITYPAMHWLNQRKIPPALSALLILLLLMLLVLVLALIIVPLFIDQIMALIANLSGFTHWVEMHISPIMDKLSIDFALDSAHLKAWLISNEQTAKALLMDFANHLSTNSLAFVTLLTSFILFPLLLFYFLRDGKHFMRRIALMIPRRYIGKTTDIIKDIDHVLGQFLRGQLLVMLIMSLFYGCGLMITGLHSGFSIGIITGLLVFIPYVGALIGALLAIITMLVQVVSWTQLWMIAAVFAAGQIIEGNYLTPKLVGQKIGLHPIMVIFALLAFGQLLGFVGLLVALPLAAILQVGYQHFKRYYLASAFYRRRP